MRGNYENQHEKNLTLIKDDVFIFGCTKSLQVPTLLANILRYYKIKVEKLHFFINYLKTIQYLAPHLINEKFEQIQLALNLLMMESKDLEKLNG